MRATAAVINAGVGDISLGLQMAGFKVVAAYEADEKALAIHKSNLDIPVYQLSPEQLDLWDFPEVDLLAIRLYLPSFPTAARVRPPAPVPSLQGLRELLTHGRIGTFFLLVNAAAINNERLREFLAELAEGGYQFDYRVIDVAQATGAPVKERMICVVGIRQSTEKRFEFSADAFPTPRPPERYLQPDETVDPWYFHVDLDRLQYEKGRQFFCWKNNAYAATDLIQWNNRMIPLVINYAAPRRITHREIANLKGFPLNYKLPDANKQWLYKKLMYAGNVQVIKQVAGMIGHTLSDNPWRSRQVERGERFEALFARYISAKGEAAPLVMDQEPMMKERRPDFALRLGEHSVFFELKYYNSSSALSSKVRTVCGQLSPFKSIGLPILVIANEVPAPIKSQCLEEYGIYIWDVSNLLWLFNEFTDIKNEFIATLNYAIENIEPKQPIPALFQEAPESQKAEPGWKEKLLQIPPGLEQFTAYESLCTDILKYVLGDYLTLWAEQKTSNDGLYRFDLCCKIKKGADHDFFDTIRHYINTKYMVFEFKNYSEKITQKEIYTTEKYLYEKALRKVAVIISRYGADEHGLQAARGCLRETGKLILCLSDDALLEMIDIKERGEQEPADFLGAILDDLLVHLEK